MSTLFFLFAILACTASQVASATPPNIIFALLDDVGSNDLGYHNVLSRIPTPNIDRLATGPGAVRLSQYYVHSLCTPSRAALMTGRYSLNTGLTSVLVPGTPAGLPADVPTLPEMLKKEAGYSTAMSGKWHLGSAQHRQTPTGRGFDEFIGMYMWDCDYHTKIMYQEADNPFAIYWVHTSANSSWKHFAEPRHSTEAITANAVHFMQQHGIRQRELEAAGVATSPLFLYVAFTAAHSPLQPLPRHYAKCRHIRHYWRREFCGLVVGLDEALLNISSSIQTHLGDNSILVVSSDNGGSPWFGGMNEPLRGTKASPFEGGVRVPGFAVDFSANKEHLGGLELSGLQKGRKFDALMHISDWMPTLLGIAGVPASRLPAGMDGLDLSQHWKASDAELISTSPRQEVLIELVPAEDAMMLKGDLLAFRLGDMKYVKGYSRDSHWYSEPRIDRLNSTENTMYTFAGEMLIRFFEMIVGSGAFDTSRIVLTHNLIHGEMAKYTKEKVCPKYFEDPTFGGADRYKYDCELEKLYNLTADPSEKRNVILEHPEIAEQIRQRIDVYRRNRPAQVDMKAQTPLDEWRKTYDHTGDCSTNPLVPQKYCRFIHPWIPDDVEPFSFGETTNAVAFADMQLTKTIAILRLVAFSLVMIIAMSVLVWWHGPLAAPKKDKDEVL